MVQLSVGVVECSAQCTGEGVCVIDCDRCIESLVTICVFASTSAQPTAGAVV